MIRMLFSSIRMGRVITERKYLLSALEVGYRMSMDRGVSRSVRGLAYAGLFATLELQ